MECTIDSVWALLLLLPKNDQQQAIAKAHGIAFLFIFHLHIRHTLLTKSYVFLGTCLFVGA
jgi:hypothetical protein